MQVWLLIAPTAARFAMRLGSGFVVPLAGKLRKSRHFCVSCDAFYRAAMAAGGKDFGGPGLRPHYHANYYGAFVLDPDGHNIEAVCHTPV